MIRATTTSSAPPTRIRPAPTPAGASPSGPSAWAVPVVPKQREARRTWSRAVMRAIVPQYLRLFNNLAKSLSMALRRQHSPEDRLDAGVAPDDVARAGVVCGSAVAMTRATASGGSPAVALLLGLLADRVHELRRSARGRAAASRLERVAGVDRAVQIGVAIEPGSTSTTATSLLAAQRVAERLEGELRRRVGAVERERDAAGDREMLTIRPGGRAARACRPA